jgi:hypothetical protein
MSRLASALAVLVAAAASALAGCGGGGHRVHETTTAATSSAAPDDTATLACDDDIDSRRPGSTGLHVVLGVVALPTAPAYGALQTSRTGRHGRLRLFAKTGLVIKPHATFALVVPAALRRRMAIGWGNGATSPPRGRLMVGGCGHGQTASSRWLVYAGGYYVSHPACLPLLVQAHGQSRRVRIGLGAPCPGQHPPPQPTQS